MSAADPQDEFRTRNPGVNLKDVLSEVREAFGRIESAFSHLDAERCRPAVTEPVFREVEREIRRLADRGRRRIHAGFEVLDAELEKVGTLGDISVRVRAVSTLEEFDVAMPRPPGASQFIWVQDVDVLKETREGAGRWLIAGLGELAIQKEVSGPVRDIDPATLAQLDALEAEQRARDREDEEWSEGQTHAMLSFLRLRGVGM